MSTELKISVLGSGSRGNSIIIQADENAVMIDAGLSANEIRQRTASCNIRTESIVAVLITHEHADHVRGLKTFAKNFSVPVYLHEAIADGVDWLNLPECVKTFREWDSIKIGNFEIQPIPVFHDSIAPVGFVVRYKNRKVSIITDAGEISKKSRAAIIGSDIIVIEANYDSEMLQNSKRPETLKKRMASQHMSNAQCAEILSDITTKNTSEIVLLHLSDECNMPELAKSAVNALKYIQKKKIQIQVANQNEILNRCSILASS